jgi:hypothetical protein
MANSSQKHRLVEKAHRWGGCQGFASAVFLIADFLDTAGHRTINRSTISIR